MMKLSNACSVGAAFLAFLTLFSTCGSASIPDYECFLFSSYLPSHPCSCFGGPIPGDKCAAGDPTGVFNSGNVQGLYDTGCTDTVQNTCNNTPNLYDCGDVIFCNRNCDYSSEG